MVDLHEELNNFRTAVYGAQVRSAMVSAITKLNSEPPSDGAFISYSTAQSLTDAQKERALANAGAAPATLVSTNGLDKLCRIEPPNTPGNTTYYRALCLAKADASTKYWLLMDRNGHFYTGTQNNGATTVTWSQVDSGGDTLRKTHTVPSTTLGANEWSWAVSSDAAYTTTQLFLSGVYEVSYDIALQCSGNGYVVAQALTNAAEPAGNVGRATAAMVNGETVTIKGRFFITLNGSTALNVAYKTKATAAYTVVNVYTYVRYIGGSIA